MFDVGLVAKTLIILLLGVISPGPDFFMVLRNSLSSGRKAGLISAAGIGTGCFISFSILICGLKFLFTYKIVKIALSLICGSYLIYLGIMSIKSKSHHERVNYETAPSEPMLVYYRNGFFTNVFNPKLYTISGAILTFTEQQHPSIITNAGIVIGNAIMVFCWFASVALILSHPTIQTGYFKREQLINRILGFILIVVGARVLFG